MAQIADETKGQSIDRPANTEKDRVELLLRQVENKVTQEGEHTDAAAAVNFMRLLESADTSEKLKIYLGWFFAALTGAILPTFFFFIGPIFDSFSDGAV